ncbi:unnamed protein product [Effrenium voratum]|nr:unnamed protein product [Effrenium voratum]
MAPLTEILPQLRGSAVLLFNWDIDDAQAAEISPVLRGNASLTALNLGGNRIGDQGIMALFPVLLQERLSVLHLHGNHIGDGGATILAEAVKASESLREIYLGDNCIGDIGAEALAAALAKSGHGLGLSKLQLMKNSIGDKGAAKLAEALVQNQTLCELDLSRNQISIQGLARLQDAEAGHPSLRLEAKVSESEAKEVKLEQDEFLMEVDTSKDKFGINLTIDKVNRTLKISSIDSSGLVARWNEAASDPVKVGDFILQVNSFTLVEDILNECRKAQVQKVVLKHAEHVLKPNQRIVMRTFRDRPQEVGKKGKTLQWFGSMMRWKVRLDDGTVLMCRGSDLEATEVVTTDVHVGDMIESSGERGVVYARGFSPSTVLVAFPAGCREVPCEGLEPVQSQEFLVFLDKGATDAKLGLDVAPRKDGSLEVTAVGSGLVQDWNQCSSSGGLVQVGDRIMQVNSSSGQSTLLLEECRQAQKLMLRLHRRDR